MQLSELGGERGRRKIENVGNYYIKKTYQIIKLFTGAERRKKREKKLDVENVRKIICCVVKDCGKIDN